MARYVKSGTVNTVQEINSELEKIATAQDEFLTRDGEAPNEMKNTLDMNSNRVINLKAPVSGTDAARLVDVTGEYDITVGIDESPVFDNIAEMTSTNLTVGQLARCKRYYSGGDLVDDLVYEIQATSTVDSYIDHANANGTFAILTSKSSLTLEKAGAVGDGVTNDYLSLKAAGNFLKTVGSPLLSLNPNKSYFCQGVDDVYLNFVEGNGSEIIIDGFNCTYADGVEKKFYMNNVDIVVVGDRNSESVTSNTPLYPVTSASQEIEDLKISNVNFICLTTLADRTSWSDDAGKTRYSGILRTKAKKSLIENVNVYGVGLGFVVYANGSNDHQEKNVSGYNVQTLLWVTSTDIESTKFNSGESTDLKIINTPTQKGYWIGKTGGTQVNGMSTILIEANHEYRYLMDNVGGAGMLERAIYGQSSNMLIRNPDSKNTGAGNAMMKFDSANNTIYRENNVVEGAVNFGVDAVTDHQLYGQRNAILNNFQYTSDVKNGRRSIELSRRNDGVTIINGYIKNAGTGFYFTSQDFAGSYNNIVIEDVLFENVFNGNSIRAPLFNFLGASGDYLSPTIDGLTLKNISVKNKNDIISTELSTYAYEFFKVDNLLLNNCEGQCNVVPFDTSTSTNVKVVDCHFELVSGTTFSGALTNLVNSTVMKANQFDFEVDCVVNTNTIPAKFKMHFQKLSDSGLVNCGEHWDWCEVEYNIPPNTAIFESITLADFTNILSATLNDSKIEILFDGAGLSSTQQYSVGSDLSHTDLSKYRIYNDGGVIRLRTTSTVLSGGVLKIRLVR